MRSLVHGRWLESQAKTDYSKYDKLCIGNAKSYWQKNDGYKRGNTPEIGAVACFSGGSKGYGHVCYVEKKYENGDILTSNSSANGSRFFTKRLYKSKKYSFGSLYKLQGFIYNPTQFGGVTDDVKRDKTKNQVKVVTKDLRVREDHNTKSKIIGYAKYKGYYNYDLTYQDTKYKWYRIDENQWIANNGKWLKVYPKEK